VALRASGLDVITCSINRPVPTQIIGPEEKEAAASSFYVLAAASDPFTFLCSAIWVVNRPWHLLRVLRAIHRSGAASLKGYVRQFFYVGEAMVLARHLDRHAVTRIHNQLGMSSASVSLYTSLLLNIPFSFTLHGPDDFYDGVVEQLGSKIAYAQFVACISRFSRNQAMVASDPRHWHKLRIVRCGLDPSRYEAREWSDRGQHILFVGRLVPVKGVSLLLDAFARVAQIHLDARLTIIGDGVERAHLERRCRSLGISSRVDFTGYLNQQEVAEQLKNADLFVLPSYAEGLPVVLMEAMAGGVPVIATRIAGIPELVQDGVTGRLVTAGDVEQLVEAICAHLADPSSAAEMVMKGRTMVLNDHDVRVEAAKLRDLFARSDTMRPLKPDGPVITPRS
jgi:glycosyltransferase involved in cell wall biosynthesis